MSRSSLSIILVLMFACAPGPDQVQTPTWHKTVRPIIEAKCSRECHHPEGIGIISFDETSIKAFAPLMLARIDSGDMPPWPPGPASMQFQESRALTTDEIETFRSWVRNPVMGDPSEYRAPEYKERFDLGRDPDLTTLMPNPYKGSPSASDELRCFLVSIKPGSIKAYRLRFGSPQDRYHHAGAQIITSIVAQTVVNTLDGKDGRPGWDCGAGVPEYISNLTHTRVGPDTGYVFPDGHGISIPDGAWMVLNFHYQPFKQTEPDRSGMDLWYTSDSIVPIYLSGVTAPSEVPCPSGVDHDPTHICSREYAVAHALIPVSGMQSAGIFSQCGQSIEDLNNLPYAPGQDHFYVPGSCTRPIAVSGTIISVGGHAHPNTVSMKVEIAQGGSWTTVLDVPKWRWVWESRYALVNPIKVDTSTKVRLTCVYDNGLLAQPSAYTHEYGHDAPAIPPLDPPEYKIWDQRKNASMCIADFDIEPGE